MSTMSRAAATTDALNAIAEARRRKSLGALMDGRVYVIGRWLNGSGFLNRQSTSTSPCFPTSKSRR